MKPKITVVGAGNVGAQCAYRLAQREVAEVILIDVVEGLPQGKALDMAQAGAIDGFSLPLQGTNDYAATANSDVVIITAGLARKPGMSRDDLIGKNAGIIKSVVEKAVQHSPNAVLLIVTNPLDVMTYHALRVSGFPKNRVVGMAPLLDAARMQYFIAQTAKVSLKEVYAEVLGSHGDLMVPVPRLSTIKGRPITEILSTEQVKTIVDKTINGGAEIVALLKSGSAYYAPGSAAAQMAAAIVNNTKELITSCCYLSGEYELNGVALGVPARLGKNGIEEIVKLELTKEELIALHHAAQAIKTLYSALP